MTAGKKFLLVLTVLFVLGLILKMAGYEPKNDEKDTVKVLASNNLDEQKIKKKEVKRKGIEGEYRGSMVHIELINNTIKVISNIDGREERHGIFKVEDNNLRVEWDGASLAEFYRLVEDGIGYKLRYNGSVYSSNWKYDDE